MKHFPLVECSTEENAQYIAKQFGCDYVFTGHGAKPWLVIGNHEQRLTFERWMVDLSVNKQ